MSRRYKGKLDETAYEFVRKHIKGGGRFGDIVLIH